MNYRIGLYLDNDKIGWSAIAEDEKGQACHIERVGVRFFPPAENAYNGASPYAERRMHRLARRRYARVRYRLRKLTELFFSYGLPPIEKLVHKPTDYLWQLRTEALDRQLTPEEWVRVLYHIAHHRGFQPGQPDDPDMDLPDSAKIRKAIRANQQRLTELNCRTIGELFYRDPRFRPNGIFAPFKTGIPYITCISRSMVRDEASLLFHTQRVFGNAFAGEDFEQQYIEILCRQRHTTEGPGINSPYANHRYRFGGVNCPLEPSQERCPAASSLAERFRFLCMVNAPYSIPPQTQPVPKSMEQRQQILKICEDDPSLILSATRDALNLNTDTPCNLFLEGIPRSAVSMSNWVNPHGRKLLLSLSEQFPEERHALQHHWDDILNLFVSTPEKKLKKHFKSFRLSAKLCETLISSRLIKRANYSRKAIERMLPLMEQGLSADEARNILYPGNMISSAAAKLNFNNFYHIARASTKRTLSQAIVIIKALLREYGMPTTIQISTSFEMGKPLSVRKKYAAKQASYQNLDEKNRILASELLQRTPTNDEADRLFLWQRQKHQCLYTGADLTLEQALSPNETVIKHVIPYSDCYNHSFSNLVLVLRSAANHCSQLPYLRFGDDSAYLERVNALPNQALRINLLSGSLSPQDVLSRRLYAMCNPSPLLNSFSSFLYRTLSAQSNTLQTVRAVNSSTIGLRPKRVFSELPDAMRPAAYAVITAICDESTCEQLSKFFSANYEGSLFQPWPTFRQEFSAFCTKNTHCFSHMPRHKARGAAHRDTLLRKRPDEVVSKCALTQLKLTADNEISDYYQPHRDRLLYEALRNQLIAHDGNAAKAFATPFFKPTSDGTPGPLVKSVPIIQRPRSTLPVRGGIGVRSDMIRIDVFRTSQETYYMVPIYVKDTLQPTLPLRAVTQHTDCRPIMDEKDFLFSLYPNDVIYLETPTPIRLKNKTSSDTIEIDHGYFTRGKIRTQSATFEITTLDNQYFRVSIPFHNLKSLYKCEVDPLGNTKKIMKPEKRMVFIQR